MVDDYLCLHIHGHSPCRVHILEIVRVHPMAIILHLGVADVPYGHTAPARGKRRAKKRAVTTTTGDVAEILEAKYHIMEHFYQMRMGAVASALEKSLKATLESLLLGGPPPLSPFDEGTSKIEADFKDFLDRRLIERLGYPGIPTQAAKDGVNHRLLHPYAKGNTRRPSFIDTGLYQASFKAWVDMK